jgi:hypothetical protein
VPPRGGPVPECTRSIPAIPAGRQGACRVGLPARNTGQVDDSGYPVPQRIGDAERDQAADFLREHLAQGRLDAAEFDERLTAALNARVQTDLDRLFTDLPAPTPRTPAVQPAATTAMPQLRPQSDGLMSRRMSNTLDLVTGLLWPVTIGLLFLIGWEHWYLIFIPIALSSVWGHRKEQDKAERDRRRKELDQRNQDGDN